MAADAKAEKPLSLPYERSKRMISGGRGFSRKVSDDPDVGAELLAESAALTCRLVRAEPVQRLRN
jgi:hypothetical protein